MIDRTSRYAVNPVATTNPASPQAPIPNEWPGWVGGHWGAGQPCATCTEAIGATQAEVRALFQDESRTFHARCFVEWWQTVAAKGAA